MDATKPKTLMGQFVVASKESFASSHRVVTRPAPIDSSPSCLQSKHWVKRDMSCKCVQVVIS
jgi:hypothetical protein